MTTMVRPPSAASIAFLISLASDRVAPQLGSDGEERIENVGAMIENGVDQREVSRLIDFLKRQPRDTASVDASATPNGQDVKPGVYEVTAGEIYVVKLNREKTRVYAKRMIEVTSDRLNADDDMVKIDFQYAPGAIRKIRPEHQMDAERAKALTIRYGRCIACGHGLKVGQSVERGIGPVCIKYFR